MRETLGCDVAFSLCIVTSLESKSLTIYSALPELQEWLYGLLYLWMESPDS